MKNKLLISFILFITILSIFTCSFASTDLEFSDGNNYSLPDFSSYVVGKEYCIIYGKNDNVGERLVLLPYDSSKYQVRLYESETNKYCLQLYPINSDCSYDDRIKFEYYYITSISTSSWSSTTTSDRSGFYFSGGIYGVYSTKDLLDLEGNLVFPLAPVTVEPMEMKQVEEMLPQMWTIAKMIIPVCLIIFGTLLVVYLIKSKNLLQL